MAIKNLKFITHDELMSSVETDLNSFADNGMINRGSVIKVVQRVNDDIGLKINQEKETVITIENHKGQVPTDFFKLQVAYICGQPLYLHDPREILGTVTEEHNFTEQVPVEVLKKGNACMNECGGCYWVTQLYKEKYVRYKDLAPIRLTQRSHKSCTTDCLNAKLSSTEFEMDIDNGEIVTGLKEGKLYLNYLSEMADNEGNLMVLDHALVRPYYEYAVKKHLLEQWMINNDADVAQKLMYIKQELAQARIEAIHFVSTIEYSDIQEVFKANRKRFFNRYINTIDRQY